MINNNIKIFYCIRFKFFRTYLAYFAFNFMTDKLNHQLTAHLLQDWASGKQLAQSLQGVKNISWKPKF